MIPTGVLVQLEKTFAERKTLLNFPKNIALFIQQKIVLKLLLSQLLHKLTLPNFVFSSERSKNELTLEDELYLLLANSKKGGTVFIRRNLYSI